MSGRKKTQTQLRAMGYRHGRKNRPILTHPKHTTKAFRDGHKAGIEAFKWDTIRSRYARL